MSDPVELRPPRTALVVDDDAGWLNAVRPVLASAGVELLGCTTSSRSTVTLVRKLRPSLLVIGLRTPPGEPDGISLVGPALAVHDALKVIVASSTPAPADVDAAFLAGACAFVVRPDKYIGYRGRPADVERLMDYLARRLPATSRAGAR